MDRVGILIEKPIESNIESSKVVQYWISNILMGLLPTPLFWSMVKGLVAAYLQILVTHTSNLIRCFDDHKDHIFRVSTYPFSFVSYENEWAK